MYVWMILATFIVILASFNLSPRSDIRHIQQAPIAKAAITKFLVMHTAAVKYTKKRVILMHTYPDDEDSLLAAGTITACQASDEEDEEEIGDLCPYLPIGFSYSNEINTRIFCVNAKETHEEPDEENEGETITILDTQEGEENKDCHLPDSITYVVSYEQIPPRWRNVSTNRIIPDFYYAMRSNIPVGASAGIITTATDDAPRNKLGTEYVIEGVNVKNSSIPLAVSSYDGSDFNIKNDCFTKDSDTGDFTIPCMIYVTRL